MNDVRLPYGSILVGDCIERLRDVERGSVQTCVTSPPYYGLRDYNVDGQIGLEETPGRYIRRLRDVFREVHRVLADDGTLWVNIGDSYAQSEIRHRDGTSVTRLRLNMAVAINQTGRKLDHGQKAKDLLGIPFLLAFALRADGWYLRSDIIWHKPNPMPESVTDRPTSAHEHIFLLAKSERYYYDAAAVAEPAGPFKPCGPNSRADNDRDPAHNGRKQDALGKNTYTGFNDRWRDRPTETRNKRDVWEVGTCPYPEAHFATYPPELIRPCILAGSRPGDMVLDPFGGSGTTGMVAVQEGRRFLMCELNPDYAELARRRVLTAQPPLFTEVPR